MHASGWHNKHINSKIRCIVGLLSIAVCLVAVSYFGCNHLAAVGLVVTGQGLAAFAQAGYAINHIDLSPRYAGKWNEYNTVLYCGPILCTCLWAFYCDFLDFVSFRNIDGNYEHLCYNTGFSWTRSCWVADARSGMKYFASSAPCIRERLNLSRMSPVYQCIVETALI